MTHAVLIVAVTSAFWFPIYWILGGVLFAALAFLRMMKLRKARFSCLFTLASVGCAIGAGYSGWRFSEEKVEGCVDGSNMLDVLSGTIGCGIFEFVGAGVIWFGGLFILGLIFMTLSKADNQSWMDSHMGLDDAEDELIFDL